MTNLDFHSCDTTYLTHGIHPYAAKFPPQLAEWGIETYSRQGDVVLDPFVGGGTTMVECCLSGRQGLGVDIDPLARLMTKAKCLRAKPSTLEKWSGRFLEGLETHFKAPMQQYEGIEGPPPASFPVNSIRVRVPDFPNRDYWFPPSVSMKLSLLSHMINDVEWFQFRTVLRVVLSSIIIARRKSSVANVADLVHSRPHFRPKDHIPDVFGAFSDKLLKTTQALQEFYEACSSRCGIRIAGNDARLLGPIPDDSVDLIFTSPPYVNAIDYPRAHKFSLVWLGYHYDDYKRLSGGYIGLSRSPITRWKSLSTKELGIPRLDSLIASLAKRSIRSASILHEYFIDMRQAVAEMFRVLKPASRAILVVGSSVARGIEIPTHSLIVDLAIQVGFHLEDIIYRELDPNRRYLPFNSGKFTGGIHEEYVLILIKPTRKTHSIPSRAGGTGA